MDPDGECYQLDGGTFISQESFDGICGDQRDRYMAWKNQAEPTRLVSAWDDPARLDRLVGDLIDADDGGGCFYTDAQPIDYTQGMDYSPQQLAADSGLGDTVPLACESNASYSLAHHPDIKFTATGVSRRQKGAGGLGSRFRPSCADHGQTRNVRREPA